MVPNSPGASESNNQPTSANNEPPILSNEQGLRSELTAESDYGLGTILCRGHELLTIRY